MLPSIEVDGINNSALVIIIIYRHIWNKNNFFSIKKICIALFRSVEHIIAALSDHLAQSRIARQPRYQISPPHAIEHAPLPDRETIFSLLEATTNHTG